MGIVREAERESKLAAYVDWRALLRRQGEQNPRKIGRKLRKIVTICRMESNWFGVFLETFVSKRLIYEQVEKTYVFFGMTNARFLSKSFCGRRGQIAGKLRIAPILRRRAAPLREINRGWS